MKNKYLFAAFAASSFLFSCTDSDLVPSESVTGETSASVSIPEDAISGELLVKFKPEVEDILDQAGALSRSGASRSSISSVDEVLDIAGAYSFERVFPIDKNSEERTRTAGMHLWYIVRFDESMDLQKVADDMSKLTEVAKVQGNREIKRSYRSDVRPKAVDAATSLAARTLQSGGSFDDPYLSLQWGYVNDGTILDNAYDDDEDYPQTAVAGYDVNCGEAWQKCTGDPSIIVAVMDEGVMYNHADLQANMWTNASEEFGSAEDNDGNGYAGDYYGYNFVDDSGLITYSDINDTGHATHVAGTIAAVNNNGRGVCGIAGGSGNNDGVRIMSLQIFAGESSATLLMEAKAVKYAADNGAVILQCSWGYNSALANENYFTPSSFYDDDDWAETYPLEKECMDYFLTYAGDPNGVIEGGLIIFAAGNEYAALAAYPGAYEECVCVAALGPDGTPAAYTNYSTPCGSTNMISAPGGDGEGTRTYTEGLILSTVPTTAMDGDDVMADGSDARSGYGYLEGTSMACPHVSGVAALGLSYAAQLRLHYRAEDFRRLLLESVVSLDDNMTGTKDYWYGFASYGESALHNTINLSRYRGNIGGLTDAALVLANIDGGGYGAQSMRMHNVYLSVGLTERIDMSTIFADGITLESYDVADSGIAAVSQDGNILVVTATQVGKTKASITMSDGTTQEFVITVRDAGSDSWM